MPQLIEHTHKCSHSNSPTVHTPTAEEVVNDSQQPDLKESPISPAPSHVSDTQDPDADTITSSQDSLQEDELEDGEIPPTQNRNTKRRRERKEGNLSDTNMEKPLKVKPSQENPTPLSTKEEILELLNSPELTLPQNIDRDTFMTNRAKSLIVTCKGNIEEVSHTVEAETLERMKGYLETRTSHTHFAAEVYDWIDSVMALPSQESSTF